MDSELHKNPDDRVKDFLEEPNNLWRDLNISEADGRELSDLILKNKYAEVQGIGISTQLYRSNGLGTQLEG